MLQHLGSDHLPILQTVLLSLSSLPSQKRFFVSIFRTLVRITLFFFYFGSHSHSVKEYFSLFSAAALFTSLTLIVAKCTVPFGRMKRHPQAWLYIEVKDKAFADSHRSDEDRQAYISASRYALSVIPKAEAEAWLATCSSLFHVI